MSERLIDAYDGELRFIRQFAREFAQQYPAEGGRLGIENDRSTDPHVERLIQAFALLTANIRVKLDDDFPELTDALFQVLYPHYLRPLPSMAILQFELNKGVDTPDGLPLPAGTILNAQPAIQNVVCRFRTGYETRLWPLKVTDAVLKRPPFPSKLSPPPNAKAYLRIQVECSSGLKLEEMNLKELRFALSGDAQLTAELYETLFAEVIEVVIVGRDGNASQVIPGPPREVIRPVGFANDEALLPYPPHSFPGYRLLTEFFAYPAKFAFFDLSGFDKAKAGGLAGRKLDIIFYLRSTPKQALEQGVDEGTFRLGCTPVINLFRLTAESIRLTQRQYEYQIIPDTDRRHGLEVYSVDKVMHTDPTSGHELEYRPFYSVKHGKPDAGRAFWYASRKHSELPEDRGTEVFLNLVDLAFNPSSTANELVSAEITCLNRDLPAKLQQTGDRLVFEPLAAVPASIRCLRAPGSTLRPPLRKAAHWRLLSHLNLNHLSLSGDEGRDALREYIRLYDFADPQRDANIARAAEQAAEGLTSLASRRVVDYVGGDAVSGYARGVEVEAELEDAKFAGIGTYLFASVLERFLGLYVSVNSFTRFIAKPRRGESVPWTWPPRAGDQVLL